MGRVSRDVRTRAFVPLQRMAFVLMPLSACGLFVCLVLASAELARQFPTGFGSRDLPRALCQQERPG
jgi:hypothetical protein